MSIKIIIKWKKLKKNFKDANKILKRDRFFSKGEVLMAGSQDGPGAEMRESYSGEATCPSHSLCWTPTSPSQAHSPGAGSLFPGDQIQPGQIPSFPWMPSESPGQAEILKSQHNHSIWSSFTGNCCTIITVLGLLQDVHKTGYKQKRY